ncbi:hypothetical protein [Litoreibacter roseus]|uniref:Uncharacterized protein n=1 Tax=Litoreibacter roseus TaxID=2601869 RepID=A0A6N6JCT6_9RHOB|nr:hypothetical protein [Litoreibacter roseus]GFE63138.1 hypothetical protein KIN_02120 [Litoreibacter roseus]
MQSSLRALVLSAITSPLICSAVFASDVRDFTQCPESWVPYVEMVEEIRQSFSQISSDKFLFISFNANIHNCLRESFSDSYLLGLEGYLRGFRHVLEDTIDANSYEGCLTTQIGGNHASFFVAWLPYEEEILLDMRCKDTLSRSIMRSVGER